MRRAGWMTATVWMCSVIASSQLFAASQDEIRFNRDVRPILSEKCFACHGQDAAHREADRRLDTAEGALQEHDGVRGVVPHDLNASELWRRIDTDDEDSRMPPPGTHKSVTDAEKEILKRWIEQGAHYEKHWSFEPPDAVPIPPVTDGMRNPIDAFVAERLRREGLAMSPEAAKSTWIRRVAFTLTGLPPRTEDVDAFLADDSSDARERVVDRYLASEHYGEEMARHWLDIARFADTHGLHLDNERQMWAYRDWVVRSFNRNQPFDQFTIEQLAGDLLPSPSSEQRIATGFNRCNVTSSEGGSIDAELIFRYAVDRTSTVAQTWMGLTGGCAVCHDHKFDPISQREFYALYAFFNSAADPAMDGNALLTEPVMKLETPKANAELARIEQLIEEKQATLEEIAARIDYNDPAEQVPVAPVEAMEIDWFDDAFPFGGTTRANPGQPTSLVSEADGAPVFSGRRSLKRVDPGLAQDVWEQAAIPLSLPEDGVLYAHVWLDPANPPRAIMLQYYKDGWNHRGVWGEYDPIPFGEVNTTQRVAMGPLPTSGQWARLEIPLARIGLSIGDKLTGFALTQFGGTVYWDRVGVAGKRNPADDPWLSFRAWWRHLQGKELAELPVDLIEVAKAGPDSPSTPQDQDRLRSYYLTTVCLATKNQFFPAQESLEALLKERDRARSAIPGTFIFADLPEPRMSHVMSRGQYDQPGEAVQPDVPRIFPPLQKSNPRAQANRLDLARWLVSTDHPLTARVAVNRWWQQVFGVGLVKTSGDFGSQGEHPSHAELLDWLAIHFRDSNWDVKALIRLMVTSATFAQDSRVTPEAYARDPENRLLARGPRLRLDAEQIRDNALAVSGLIDLRMGGPGVRPYQPPNIWEPVGFAGSNTRFYQQEQGPALYRRSLYTFYKRTAPPPFMANFDAPNREQSCTRRERSNTPLQALQLMNDVQHVEAARALAERMLIAGGENTEQRIAFAYKAVLARAPERDELNILETEFAQHFSRYQRQSEDAVRLIAIGESKPPTNVEPAELAALTLVASTILNLDETLTRN